MDFSDPGYVVQQEQQLGRRVSTLHVLGCPEARGLGARISEEVFGHIKGGLKRRCPCTIDHHRGREA